MGRPSAAAQDIRLPPRAPAPAPLLSPRAPCPARRSWPHLPAKHQLKRLFWQKHALTMTQLFKENISPFFARRSSRQFPERRSDHSQRPRGHSGSDGETPCSPRLCGLQVGHRSPSRQQSHSYSSWERCPGYKTSLTEPLGSPRQAPCCPGGPLLVIPYNLCTLVSHHWPDTFGCGWTTPGGETADSLPPSVMCRKVALLVTHFSLSGLCSL